MVGSACGRMALLFLFLISVLSSATSVSMEENYAPDLKGRTKRATSSSDAEVNSDCAETKIMRTACANTTAIQCPYGVQFNSFCSNELPDVEPPINVDKLYFSSCPGDLGTFTVDPGEISVMVSWPDIVAVNSNGSRTGVNLSKLTERFKNNTKYIEGYYEVIYKASSDNATTAFCTVSFKITVVRCELLQFTGGSVDCDNGTNLLGTSCYFSCDPGKTLVGSSVLTCTLSGRYDSPVPQCLDMKCARPPDPPNGYFVCPDNINTGSKCYLNCNFGYVPSSNDFLICSSSSTWQPSPTIFTCTDVCQPVFENCPSEILVFKDNNVQMPIVWPALFAKDNSGGNVRIEQTSSSIVSGSLIETGTHYIKYSAKDETDNVAICEFPVIARDISCGQPDLQDSCMTFNLTFDNETSSCENVTAPGVCNVTCRDEITISGKEWQEISCLATSTFPPDVTWTWTATSTPQCDAGCNCNFPDDPANSILTCDITGNTLLCNFSCADKAQGSLISSPASQYSCTHYNEWSPAFPPACTGIYLPFGLSITLAIQYTTSPIALNLSSNELKEEEFLIQNYINDTFYQIISCPADVRCTTQNLSAAIQGTDVTVNMIIHHTIRNPNDILVLGQVYFEQHLFNQVTEFSKYIETELSPGNLTLNHSSDTNVGSITFDCYAGMMFDETSSTCRVCPVGTFYDASTNSCAKCPIGTYQDLDHQQSCKACPTGTSTEAVGASLPSECTEQCSPGFYSKTGVLPCRKCAFGYYQPSKGQTQCLKCPLGKLTAQEGTDSPLSCHDFDLILLDSSAFVQFPQLGRPIQQFKLGFWVWVDGTNNGHTTQLVSITDSATVYLSLSRVDTVIKPIFWGSTLNCNYERVSENQWNYVEVSWYYPFYHVKSSSQYSSYITDYYLHVRVNHAEYTCHVERKADAYIRYYPLYQKYILPPEAYITLQITTGVYYSGLYFAPEILATGHITTCSSQNRGNVLITFDDLSRSHVNKIAIVVPSRCKGIGVYVPQTCSSTKICTNTTAGLDCQCEHGFSGNDCDIPPLPCLNNRCQNGSTCIDESEGYQCVCQDGYTGEFCDTAIVHGNWSAWTSWLACSATCGGVQSRLRFCNSPAPDLDGQNCTGESEEFRSCAQQSYCPYCGDLARSLRFGTEISCSEKGHLKTCSVSCASGLVIAEDLDHEPVYECGVYTSYKWVVKRTKSDSFQLPICSEAVSPGYLSLLLQGEFPGFVCDNSTSNEERLEDVQDQLVEQYNYLLPCNRSASFCYWFIDLFDCPENRSANVSLTMLLNVSVDFGGNLGADLDLPLYFGQGQGFQKPAVLKELEYAFLRLEETKQIFTETTVSIVNGNMSNTRGKRSTHDIYNSYNMQLLGKYVQCPTGSSAHGGVCAQCPPGTKAERGNCYYCDPGTYQDSYGGTRCHSCSGGYWSNVGAVVCYPSRNSPTVNIYTSNNTLSIYIAVPLLVVILILVVWIIKLKCYKRKIKKDEEERVPFEEPSFPNPRKTQAYVTADKETKLGVIFFSRRGEDCIYVHNMGLEFSYDAKQGKFVSNGNAVTIPVTIELVDVSGQKKQRFKNPSVKDSSVSESFFSRIEKWRRNVTTETEQSLKPNTDRYSTPSVTWAHHSRRSSLSSQAFDVVGSETNLKLPALPPQIRRSPSTLTTSSINPCFEDDQMSCAAPLSLLSRESKKHQNTRPPKKQIWSKDVSKKVAKVHPVRQKTPSDFSRQSDTDRAINLDLYSDVSISNGSIINYRLED